MKMLTDEALEAVSRWNGILPTPSREAQKKPQGIQVLENMFLEKWIGRAHPLIPGIWVIPTSSLLFWYGLNEQTFGSAFKIAVIGFFSWTLIEYAIHSLLFHKKITSKTHPQIKFLIFMLHGYHHEYPHDLNRLVMPIIMAWPLALILGISFWLVLGTALFFPFFSGLLLGYLAYDWMHYYEHLSRPASKIGKYLRKLHLIHHFSHPEKNYGLSSPLWDWVFGNIQDK